MEQIIEIAFETLRSTRGSRYFSSVRPFFCNTVISALVHNCSLIFCLTLEFNKHKSDFNSDFSDFKSDLSKFFDYFLFIIIINIIINIIIIIIWEMFLLCLKWSKESIFCAKSAFLSFSLNLFIKSLKKFRWLTFKSR